VIGPDYPTGSIVKTVDSRGEQLYVVLRDGLQPVSAATADIVRYGDPDAGRASAREIAPAVVAGAPIVHRLPVDHYPTVSPQLVSPSPDPVVCMGWQRTNSAAQATVRLIVGHKLPVPAGAQAVRLASADGNAPGLDSVYMTPGAGEYVQVTGIEPGSHSTGPLFYVSDTGLRYHIKDLPTADALGVIGVKAPGQQSVTPQLAPWPVLAQLPPGPELSQEAALVAHDGVAPDPNSVAVPRS
jgi:type VII secretion protein EccB